MSDKKIPAATPQSKDEKDAPEIRERLKSVVEKSRQAAASKGVSPEKKVSK